MQQRLQFAPTFAAQLLVFLAFCKREASGRRVLSGSPPPVLPSFFFLLLSIPGSPISSSHPPSCQRHSLIPLNSITLGVGSQ